MNLVCFLNCKKTELRKNELDVDVWVQNPQQNLYEEFNLISLINFTNFNMGLLFTFLYMVNFIGYL